MPRKLTSWIALALVCISMTALLAGCNKPTGNPSTSSTPSVSPSPSPSQSVPPSPSATITPKGETKRYTYQNLEVEITNVKSDRKETINDDGGNPFEYTVITHYPGATLTVIKADMSDPAYAADGKAHPQWGVLINPGVSEQRIKFTDDMQPLDITPDTEGVYNLEASLYVFKFEEYAG